jgi:diguanylate cyclase (GGDEF)-like protein
MADEDGARAGAGRPEPGGTVRPVPGHHDVEHAEVTATLTRILGAIEEYVYTGEFLPDGGYRVVFVGPCREQLLGMSVEEGRTAVWADHVHPADVETFDTAHDDAHLTGRLDVQYRLVGADGRVRWVRDRGRMRLEGGRRFLDGSVLEVTDHKRTELALERARAQAHRLATIDPLTGAYNRRSLAARLAAAGDSSVGVLSVDVDHFKNVNDLYGHAAGDAVLVAVAARLRQAVRAGDAVFRMGGEEFLVLLPSLPDELALADVAESVRARIAAEPVHTGGQAIAVTASVGAARAERSSGALDVLLDAADRALYTAKRSGRNRVRLASAGADGDEEVVAESDALRMAEAMARVAAGAESLPDDHLVRVSLLATRVARRWRPARRSRCAAGSAASCTTWERSSCPRRRSPRRARSTPRTGGSCAPTPSTARASSPRCRTCGRSRRSCASTTSATTGPGYPDGLAGEDILLEARIVAAAECWVAMISARPHRAALPEDVALGQLEAAAGTHLDPRVVAALRSVLAHPREGDARVSRAL